MSKYFFLDAYGKQQGPVEMEKLQECGVGPDTMIWTKGMAKWQPAKEVVPSHLLIKEDIEEIDVPPSPSQSPLSSALTSPSPSTYPSPSPRPQGGQSGHSGNTPPDNYLVWSILVTVMCCSFLPGGIVAIVYSSKVNSYWEKGNYAEAQKCADRAKMWCYITAGVGFIGAIANLFLFLILGS